MYGIKISSAFELIFWLLIFVWVEILVEDLNLSDVAFEIELGIIEIGEIAHIGSGGIGFL